MQIQRIEPLSKWLKHVKALGRINSRTLGFLPEGAFDQACQEGKILVAIDKVGLAGYVLYRVSRGQAKIVHLCVDRDFRRRGVAAALIKKLRKETEHLEGISLLCRRDYEASHVWPRLGFKAIGEKPGRGRDEMHLTKWLLDHGHPSLFSVVDQVKSQGRLKAVIDANVFFDFQSEEKASEESKTLLADWTTEFITLLVADELLNEINRSKTHREREAARSFASQFPSTHPQPNEVEQILDVLNSVWTESQASQSESDESDKRQLAQAIADGADFFVTRDGGLLDLADRVNECFDIRILRPSDVIIYLDELIRESEYRPARLAGSRFQRRKVQQNESTALAVQFQLYDLHERKGEFRTLLRNSLSSDQKNTWVIRDREKNAHALYVEDHGSPQVMRIPLFRLSKDKLAGTLSRHLLFHLVRQSGESGRSATEVHDRYLGPEVVASLVELGFVREGNKWLRLNLRSIARKDELPAILGDLKDDSSIRQRIIHDSKQGDREEFWFDLESKLWPLKFEDLQVPNFIVPIRPGWARELLGTGGWLFDTKASLSLALENVYYRAARPKTLMAPGRILWYVSRTGKCITAASHLQEVSIGKPKDLFRRYRRLGIYEWKNLLETAKGNPEREIMAFRFRDTEVFENPVPRAEMCEIMEKYDDQGSQIQAPVQISKATFFRLYRKGTGQ